MMFDNSPPPETTRWETTKEHLPILLIVGGAVAAFIGLHTAAVAVAIGAGLHVLVGLLALGFVRKRSKAPNPVDR